MVPSFVSIVDLREDHFPGDDVRMSRPAGTGSVSLLLATVLLATAAAPAHADDRGAAAALIARDRDMQRAVVDRDGARFADFLTDDYVLITSRSVAVDKAALVASITGADVLTTNDPSEPQVRVHGATAVIVGVLHQAGTVAGKPYDAWFRYTDTWIRDRGAWRCLSGHATRLPDPR
jgi:ketosteroid isomerase-like protein